MLYTIHPRPQARYRKKVLRGWPSRVSISENDPFSLGGGVYCRIESLSAPYTTHVTQATRVAHELMQLDGMCDRVQLG